MDANNSKKVDLYSNFNGGIADFDKEGAPNSYAHGRSIDFRSNPRELTLLPETSKESGSTVTDLPKWGERVSSNSYFYGDTGNLYARTTGGSWSNLRTVPSSHGNGMKYFAEDDFLYYTSDAAIGRYGPIIAGSPTFSDDYFGSQGGVPTNTYSLSLTAASSMSADAADSASLSVTGNIAMEAYIKATSLPAVGSSMTLVGKWDESGTTMSYKMDIYGVSGYFGDAANGSLTVSVNTTDAPIDSAATGTTATLSLSATNVSFASGQEILIHQSQGTGAGTWQRNTIQGYTAGSISLTNNLNATYGTGAQVLVMKKYSNVTVNAGVTWTAKAWNGTTGGILSFIANGTVTVSSTALITASACGFRGGAGSGTGGGTPDAFLGEGYPGLGGQKSPGPNGNGGGCMHSQGSTCNNGAGGGNGTAGTNGSLGTPSQGGLAAGTADLTTMVFGGGGGGGSRDFGNPAAPDGGTGGGIIFITGTTLANSGTIASSGSAGISATVNTGGGGGGGAGGSILLKFQTGTLGTAAIVASGGAGGIGGFGHDGGAGGDGRIHIDHLTSYTGTTTPTADVIQDNTLVTTTTYQLRFGVSQNGSASEYLTKNLPTLTTTTWTRLGISWVASTSICTFYQDGTNLGTATGTKTAIHDNASLLYIGTNKTTVLANFFNGLIDDVRVWNTTRTDSQMNANKDRELGGTESGLVGYWKLNNAATDSTSNANNLTLRNSPTYSLTVPFANATTRLDIDQTDASTGQTYTLPVAVSEASSIDKHTFVPAKDPQKSLLVNINAKGTGNWTLTIHNALNTLVTSVTVANASLPASGVYEFVFSSVWRPVIGQTYHFHLTSTVADGSVVTGTVNSMATAQYTSYYQFLVTDTDYHPIERMLNFIAIGNERYVAKYDASSYSPHKLTLPAIWRVRSFAKWREYLAIGCTRVGTNIYDYDEGIIFFWDGISTTYNFYVDVPEGGINAMLGSRGILYVWAGYQGDLLGYVGGDKADKIKRIPKITKDKYIEVMPGAVGMWQSLMRFGVAGNSDSSVVERGVYTYGQINSDNPVSLSYDYPISTGNRAASNIKIGSILPIDRKLLIGWKDNTAYGVDVVNLAGNPYSTGTVERLIKDYGAVWKEKEVNVVRADFKALRAGESVQLKYKKDRDTNWTLGSVVSTAGLTSARLPITKGNHKELQIAADLATSTTTAPTLLELTAQEDLRESEELI